MFLHLSVSLFTGSVSVTETPTPCSVEESGTCMAGRHARQERRPLQQAVRILLECILVSTRFTAPLRDRNKFIIPEQFFFVQFVLFLMFCFRIDGVMLAILFKNSKWQISDSFRI